MRSLFKKAGWIALAVAPLWVFWIAAHRTRLPERTAPSRDAGTPVLQKSPTPSRTASPRRLQVTGEVVERDGRPARGIPVTLVDVEGRGDVLAPGRAGELRDRETITDELGRFQFLNLSPGRVQVIARPAARPAAWTEPFLLDRAVHQTLAIPAPVILAGLTHPQATLTFAVRVPGLPHAGHQPVASTATADETGGYRAEGLCPSAAFFVTVEAPGYRARTFGPYQFPPGRHIMDFDLDTGLSLRGRVVDGAGRPVAGAQVTFDDARTSTDADGAFTLAGLEERTTTLVVSRAGYIQTVKESVRPGSVDLTIFRAAEVSGRIPGGRGRYLCFSVGAARYRLGLGDSEQFRLPSVPPGPLRLDVEDDARRVLGTAYVDAAEGGSLENVEIVVE